MLATLLLAFTAAVAAPAASTDLGRGASVRPLAPDVWLYVSERASDGVASNSLVVSLPGGPLLVDPPWGDPQTDKVLDWVQRALGRPVAGAVSTHSHEDRTGGVAALRRRGIATGALQLTVELTRAAGKTAPDVLFASGAFSDTRGFEVFFPGAGHAPDTIVVWFPKQRVLFGGCLVKSEESTDLGFVGDADLAQWPAAIEAVRARYPEAHMVIPGHGPPGTVRALERTLELLEARTKATP
jgi:glyoxylase-like metal-dependent hydrolase (beta-lactamase superfamily II)